MKEPLSNTTERIAFANKVTNTLDFLFDQTRYWWIYPKSVGHQRSILTIMQNVFNCFPYVRY